MSVHATLAHSAPAELETGFIERHSAELQRQRLAAIVESAADALGEISLDGILNYWSPAAERMFGWRPSEVLGRNINMLMPEPYRSQHDGYLHRYL